MANNVKWRTSVKMTSPTEGVVSIKAIVADGWHIYGTDLPKGGPKATAFDFSTSTGVKFVGDFKPSVKPETKLDKLFDLKLSYWHGTVVFSRRFKVVNPKNACISGKITYMACNGTSCMPPKTESVKVTVPPFKK